MVKVATVRLMLTLGILALTAPVLAQSAGSLRGKVLDEAGKPVKGITIRVEEHEGDSSKEATTKKNGGFAFGRLRPGHYRILAVDADRFVSTLEFEARNSAGLTVGQGSMDGHPTQGAGPFVFRGALDVQMTLVIADRQSEQARGLVLAFVAPELNEAVELYKKGEFAATVERTTALLVDNPELGEAHYMQGIAHKRMGANGEAARALDEAAARMPDYPEIWIVLGDSYLLHADELEQAGQAAASRAAYTRAAEVLEEALERGPETIRLLIDLATALDRIDADDRLIPVLERVLAQEPGNLQAKLRLASLYSARKDYERAQALLDEIPDTETKAATTIYNLAVQLNESGDIDASAVLARRAAQINPELPQPQQLLVQVHLARGEHPQAAAAIRRFLELAPEAPEAESYRSILAQIEAP